MNVWSAQCQGLRRRQHWIEHDKGHTPNPRTEIKIPDPAGNRTRAAAPGWKAGTLPTTLRRLSPITHHIFFYFQHNVRASAEDNTGQNTKDTHPIPGQKLKFLTPSGIEPGPPGWKAGTLPTTPRPRILIIVKLLIWTIFLIFFSFRYLILSNW